MISTKNIIKFLGACAIALTTAKAQAQFVVFGDTISDQEIADGYRKAKRSIVDKSFTMDVYKRQLIERAIIARYAKEQGLDKSAQHKGLLRRFTEQILADSLKSRKADAKLFRYVKQKLVVEADIEQIAVFVNANAAPADTLRAYNTIAKAHEMALNKVPFQQIREQLKLNDNFELAPYWFGIGKHDLLYDRMVFEHTQPGSVSKIERCYYGYVFVKVKTRRYYNRFYRLRELGKGNKGLLPWMPLSEVEYYFGNDIYDKKAGDILHGRVYPYENIFVNIDQVKDAQTEIDLQTNARYILDSNPDYVAELKYLTAQELACRYGFGWHGGAQAVQQQLFAIFNSNNKDKLLAKNRNVLAHIEGKPLTLADDLFCRSLMVWSFGETPASNMRKVFTEYLIRYYYQKLLQNPKIKRQVDAYEAQLLENAVLEKLMDDPTEQELKQGSKWMEARIAKLIDELKRRYNCY